jgi:hypothetical protein
MIYAPMDTGVKPEFARTDRLRPEMVSLTILVAPLIRTANQNGLSIWGGLDEIL